ncbi:TetR/AcrR family transcriptional regulator [Porticoccaceae bacterium nBUS_17]
MYSQAQHHPGKPKRKEQSRTRLAKAKMISVATPMFAEKGYGATSISEIEIKANVKRGMLVYHFKTKRNLWMEVADRVFSPVAKRWEEKSEGSLAQHKSPKEKVEILIRDYVRTAAEFPEIGHFYRKVSCETSWRLEYLVTNYLQPEKDYLEQINAETLWQDPRDLMHWYYILYSSCSAIFSSAPECKMQFGINSLDKEVVEHHADILVNLLLNNSPKPS